MSQLIIFWSFISLWSVIVSTIIFNCIKETIKNPVKIEIPSFPMPFSLEMLEHERLTKLYGKDFDKPTNYPQL